jgi:hypothetical protein
MSVEIELTGGHVRKTSERELMRQAGPHECDLPLPSRQIYLVAELISREARWKETLYGHKVMEFIKMQVEIEQ